MRGEKEKRTFYLTQQLRNYEKTPSKQLAGFDDVLLICLFIQWLRQFCVHYLACAVRCLAVLWIWGKGMKGRMIIALAAERQNVFLWDQI